MCIALDSLSPVPNLWSRLNNWKDFRSGKMNRAVLIIAAQQGSNFSLGIAFQIWKTLSHPLPAADAHTCLCSSSGEGEQGERGSGGGCWAGEDSFQWSALPRRKMNSCWLYFYLVCSKATNGIPQQTSVREDCWVLYWQRSAHCVCLRSGSSISLHTACSLAEEITHWLCKRTCRDSSSKVFAKRMSDRTACFC